MLLVLAEAVDFLLLVAELLVGRLGRRMVRAVGAQGPLVGIFRDLENLRGTTPGSVGLAEGQVGLGQLRGDFLPLRAGGLLSILFGIRQPPLGLRALIRTLL